ncbi:MAG: hypothetical protein LUD19_00800 [Clostridia bacterium]|nr:hypothetical protein [Clostridia bacterium]MCD8308361.1 hypothetical protein [Clostridia bacterium]
MEKFVLGLAVGMAGGAIIVANNCKLRALIKKNQEEMMDKAEKYIDEKLEKAGCTCADGQEEGGLD